MRVYADHAATTPVDPRVVAAMLPYFSERFGNASSIHAWGQEAREAVERAREILASAIGAAPQEIVFTSGATEADNLALLGAAYAAEHRGKHIVTTAVEHHAVLESCRFLAARGFEITILPVDRFGRVDPDDVRAALRPDTILVSVMHANNEIGTIEPVEEIGRLVRDHGAVMHSDAAQTLGILPVKVDALSVDLLSVSAHKRYGPKGVGALYVRRGTPLARIQHGGAHERNRRAGTENVPGIVGFGEAVRIAEETMAEEAVRLRALRDRLAAGLTAIPGARRNGDPQAGLPGVLSVSFEGTDSESLLVALDLQGVAASSGSACTSGSLEPSHVLAAIGLPPEAAKGTVRFSLGRGTTPAEVDYLLQVTPEIVARVRAALRPADLRR
ncbi:MAG: cysteine desulfurase family protein [Armatimonadota bacterium]|nr:cysteine desulfurase family protein [Armatimonadota bacterium]MDR7451856.1 cysteine desulfurase family protein [Armatimonadota bacterium]MDR7467581.1 cysteine desulfurase family protein [Armatimonadota bacterium]MDR7494458.1 cysteine desulfurase family protein [Armatimonadota bacterium]MDR7499719.1 cysteine desulfurase family protein [Armatimonadota bacterium]